MKRKDLPRGADDAAADPPQLLIDPVLRWAVAAGDASAIKYVDGVSPGAQPLPYVGDVITHPRFVDPATGQPVAVRVVHIQQGWDETARRHVLAVVVTRAPAN